ncbi:L domain-like protein [Neocallimastix sp. 'constans']
MKSLVVSLFSINLLSNVILLSGAVSQDCAKLNEFLGKSQDSECCKKGLAECVEGFITTLKLSKSDISEKSEFSRFPTFERLITLGVGIPGINGNILPSTFFDQPNLNKLEVYESNISSIPKFINKNCPVTEINLEHNALSEFPTQFSDLPNLQHLYLMDNKISGTIDLKNFKSLNEIFVFENPIAKIPDEVTALADLIEFDFSSTEITELPPDLFKLPNLKQFKISNNSKLKTRVINFGNKNINDCALDGTDILCYQSETCANINTNSFTPCTSNDIEEIKSKQSKAPLKSKNKSSNINNPTDDNNKNNNLGSIIGLIGGAIVVVLIISIIGFVIVQIIIKN